MRTLQGQDNETEKGEIHAAMKEVFDTINKSWQWYRRYAATPPKQRDDAFWERCTNDLKIECRNEPKQTEQLYRALLVAMIGRLEEERKVAG